MSRAVAIITEQVRERVRRDGIDLGSDRELADRYVRDEVQRYSERALGGSLPMAGLLTTQATTHLLARRQHDIR